MAVFNTDGQIRHIRMTSLISLIEPVAQQKKVLQTVFEEIDGSQGLEADLLDKNENSSRQKRRRKDLLSQDPVVNFLPTEMQHMIMTRLPQKELLKMRLVSHAWKQMVDQAFHFDVILDDRRQDFTGKCTLSMRKCQVKSVVGTKNRFVFSAPSPQQVMVHYRICQWNFREMSSKWQNLTKLKLCWRPMIHSYLFKQCPKLDSRKSGGISTNFFPHLKCMGLSLFTSFYKTDPVVLQNLKYMLHWNYENLRHLSFNFVFPGMTTDFYKYIHPFLERHAARKLNKVEFSLSYTSFPTAATAMLTQRNIIFDQGRWPSKKLDFKTSSDYKMLIVRFQKPKDDEETNEWIDFLSNRLQLQILIHEVFLSVFIRNFTFFERYLKKCSKFLRILELMCLSVYQTQPPFIQNPGDLAIFKDCTQLKGLSLWRAPILINEHEPEMDTELVNMISLPISLKYVLIDGLPIASMDIIESLKRLKNLKCIRYYRSIIPRRRHNETVGFNRSVLIQLLQHPGLLKATVNTSSENECLGMADPQFSNLAINHSWKDITVYESWQGCYRLVLRRM